MTRDHQLLLQKVANFTDTEFIGLEAWLIAAEVGLYDLSARILRSSLDLEHYQSVLHLDPDTWTEEQRTSLSEFVAAFESDVAEFEGSPKIQARQSFRAVANRIAEAIDRLKKHLRGPVPPDDGS